MPHVTLLGDSIFDNGAYVLGAPDVVTHLRRMLPPGWEATLAAVDGALVADVERQLGRIPAATTHLALSIGGNDALGSIGVLDRQVGSVAEAMDLLHEIRERFDESYRRMLVAVLDRALPLTICTIYEGNLGEESLQRRASTALTVFNDVILRNALDVGAGVIDLRRVCSEPEDYANPIEPSDRGGAKIAASIRRALAAGA